MTKQSLADLRTAINTAITNETDPDSISPADVGGNLVDMLDSLLHVDMRRNITVSTGEPDDADGNNGDLHLETDSNSHVTSLWVKASSTWGEHPVFDTGSAITSGTADPTGGSSGDLYLKVNSGNQIVSIHFRTNTWNEFTLPSGGGGTNVKGAWAAATTYNRGDIVTHDDVAWIQYGAATRLSASSPPADPLFWFKLGRVLDFESASVYRIGDLAIGSDDRLYICVLDGANVSTNPVSNPDQWFLFNPVRQGLAWNNTRAYARGDSVFQSSKMFMCLAETSTGTNPTTSGQTHWVEVGGGTGGATSQSIGHRFEKTTGFELLDGTPEFEDVTVNIPQRLLDDRTQHEVDLLIEAEAVASSGTGSARLDIRDGTNVIATSGDIVLSSSGMTLRATVLLPATATSFVARVTRVGTVDVQVDSVTVDVVPEYIRNNVDATIRSAIPPQTVSRSTATDLAVAAPTNLAAGAGTTIPLDGLGAGSILSALDSTEESVVITPGVYIVEANFMGVKNAVTSARSSVGFRVQRKNPDDTWTTIVNSAAIYVRGVANINDELEFLRPEARFSVTESTTIRIQALSLPFWGIPAVPPIAWSFQEVDITFYAIGGIAGPAGADGSPGAPGAGEDNVQADWDEADTTSDAFIQNKPTIPDTPDHAATSKEYNLRVPATSGDPTWTEDTGGGSGPTGIPNAPDHESEVKKYNLQVPATSGDPTWEEDTGGGGSGTGTGIQGALIAVAGNFPTGNQNLGSSIAGVAWTKADGAPTWISASGTTLRLAYAGKDDEPGIPNNADGFLIRAFVNTAATGQTAVWEQRGFPIKLPFGFARQGTFYRRYMHLSATERVGIQVEQLTSGSQNGSALWRPIGNSTPLPANLQLRAYWSLAGGGEKGERGVAGAGFGAAYFYHAKGSTARYGNEFPNTLDPVSNRGRLEFKSDNPDEKFYTENNPASWWVANPTNLDSTGAPAIATARVVFRPPAGTWLFTLQFKMSGAAADNGIGMFEVKSGTDDEIIVEPVGSLTVMGFGAATQVVGRIESDELITDGTREFYFMGNWDIAAALNYYLRAVKVA